MNKDYERALMLLDDVEQSMRQSLKDSKYTALWDEGVPIDAWHEDIVTVLKLLAGNL